MKALMTFVLLFTATQARAGAYHTECSNQDGSVTLDYGVRVKGAAADGERDFVLVGDMGKFAGDIPSTLTLQDLLRYKDKVWVLERLEDRPLRTIISEGFSDECGNNGTHDKFSGFFRVLDGHGKVIAEPTELTCDYRGISGHCS